ncbi:transposable element Tcb1 transposase [Trichonephila clavipes]|nr:transposable element Tcb1 transposase [Trichonephila clavipes]
MAANIRNKEGCDNVLMHGSENAAQQNPKEDSIFYDQKSFIYRSTEERAQDNILKYVRRRTAEMLHPDCIQATVKYPHSFIFYSCISADGIGHRHIIDGTLNVIKYIDTILEPKLLPSARDLFTNNASFVIQQDSAPCHTLK